MKVFDKLLNTKRYCYWLAFDEPSETDPNQFQVVIVFEGESGYWSPVGGDIVPWYWDEETCETANRDKLGLQPDEIDRIIADSMVGDVGPGLIVGK